MTEMVNGRVVLPTEVGHSELHVDDMVFWNCLTEVGKTKVVDRAVEYVERTTVPCVALTEVLRNT